MYRSRLLLVLVFVVATSLGASSCCGDTFSKYLDKSKAAEEDKAGDDDEPKVVDSEEDNDDDIDDEEIDDDTIDEDLNDEDDDGETVEMPKPPEPDKGAKLKTPEARKAFIAAFNKSMPKGCKLSGVGADLKRLKYQCRSTKLDRAKSGVISGCASYQLVGFVSLDMRVKDGTAKCGFAGSCSCVGEPIVKVADKDAPKKDDEVKVKDDGKVVANADGTYRGSLKGSASGRMTITISGSRVSGKATGKAGGDRFATGFSGTYKNGKISAAGKNKGTAVTVSGNVRGKSATGSVGGTINGKAAKMSFSTARK